MVTWYGLSYRSRPTSLEEPFALIAPSAACDELMICVLSVSDKKNHPKASKQPVYFSFLFHGFPVHRSYLGAPTLFFFGFLSATRRTCKLRTSVVRFRAYYAVRLSLGRICHFHFHSCTSYLQESVGQSGSPWFYCGICQNFIQSSA